MTNNMGLNMQFTNHGAETGPKHSYSISYHRDFHGYIYIYMGRERESDPFTLLSSKVIPNMACCTNGTLKNMNVTYLQYCNSINGQFYEC